VSGEQLNRVPNKFPIAELSRKMLKKAASLTRPVPAVTSPTRPEVAKTTSLLKDAPFRGQGRRGHGN
jgi:hypothetical protein